MFSSDKWFGGSAGFYNGVATQSLRFHRASSSYLIKENTSVTSTQKWTLSVWIKRGNLGTEQGILGSSSTAEYIRFESNDTLRYRLYTSSAQRISMITNAAFRDTSNFFHLVCAVDLSNTTDDDKAIIYVNGERQTLGTNITTSTDTYNSKMLQNGGHYWNLGRYAGYFDGYMADVHLIDGQQLDPTYFAETKNGVWIPKEYTGTYGNSGARLQFKQTGSSADASGIGADTSGNGNHFSANNVSSYDSNMPDSPENNFCTLNPIIASGQKASATYSQGNLQYTSTDAYDTAIGTIGVSSGKWYFETRLNSSGSQLIGARASPHEQNSSFLGQNTSNSGIGFYRPNGNVYNETSGLTAAFTATSGDIIQVAFDADNGYFWFGKDNTYTGTVDSSSGRFTLASWSSGEFIFPAQGYRDSRTVNFGQDGSFAGALTGGDVGTATDGNGKGAFKYAPPSGYLALCSANLPDTTIAPNQDEQGSDFNQVVFYDGNSSNSHQITGVGFQPDMVHIKARNQSASHYNIDSTRGIGTGDSFKALAFNSSTAQYTAENDQLRSLDADGFTLDDNTDNTWYVNRSSDTYAAWCWRVNVGTTSTNDEGTISSTVQVNNTVGMSIATYTAPSGTFSFGHGLSQAPEFFMVKKLDGTSNWIGYHEARTPSIPNNKGLYISSPSNPTAGSNWITEVSATRIGITTGQLTGTGDHLLYAWHSVDGYCKVGQYEGNNSTDNAFVYTGFLPNIIWIKNVDSGHDWVIRDLKHSGYYTDGRANPVTIGSSHSKNNPHTGGAAFTMDFLSNGFKIRHYDSDIGSAHTFMYIAWASDQTFKFSNAR